MAQQPDWVRKHNDALTGDDNSDALELRSTGDKGERNRIRIKDDALDRIQQNEREAGFGSRASGHPLSFMRTGHPSMWNPSSTK